MGEQIIILKVEEAFSVRQFLKQRGGGGGVVSFSCWT